MGLRENLRRFREERKMSQTALAERAGVKQQLISQIENGKNLTTKSRYLVAMARALNVQPSDLDPLYSPGDTWQDVLSVALDMAQDDKATLLDVYRVIERFYPAPLRDKMRLLLEVAPDRLPEVERAAQQLSDRRRKRPGSRNKDNQ